MELDRDMMGERRYKEYEEINMLHTDKKIVKGHINFKCKEDKGDADGQRPQVQLGRVQVIHTTVETVHKVP